MNTETGLEAQKTALAAAEVPLPAVRLADDLAWAIVQMRAGERIVINEALIAAYQAASSPHFSAAINNEYASMVRVARLPLENGEGLPASSAEALFWAVVKCELVSVLSSTSR